MLKLLKLVVSTTGLFSVALASLALFTPPAAQSFPFAVIHPTDDCDLPCWHDLHPGLTRRDEAQAIFVRDPAFVTQFASTRQITVQYVATPDPDERVSIYFDRLGYVSVISFTGAAVPGEWATALANLIKQFPDATCRAHLELYFPAIEADPGDLPLAHYARPHSQLNLIPMSLFLSAPNVDPLSVVSSTARIGLRPLAPLVPVTSACG